MLWENFGRVCTRSAVLKEISPKVFCVQNMHFILENILSSQLGMSHFVPYTLVDSKVNFT